MSENIQVLTPISVSRETIVSSAREWLGTPYIHQESTIGAGTDCLGLIRGVWRSLYASEPEIAPPYTPDWNERNWNRVTGHDVLLEAARRHFVESKDAQINPGDVLIFRVQRHGPAKHCGILTQEDRFIHAYAGREVCESWLNRWWRARIAGVFIFPGAE